MVTQAEVAARHLRLAVDLNDRLVLRPSAGCWCHTVVGNPTTNRLRGSNSIAPGMDRWSRLWMGLKEMMKDVQQSQNMSLMPAIELRLANIIDNHVTNFFTAML